MASLTRFIEGRLKLQINTRKSAEPPRGSPAGRARGSLPVCPVRPIGVAVAGKPVRIATPAHTDWSL